MRLSRLDCPERGDWNVSWEFDLHPAKRMTQASKYVVESHKANIAEKADIGWAIRTRWPWATTIPIASGIHFQTLVACKGPLRKGDFDNLQKQASDALNHVVWEDDAYIFEAYVQKKLLPAIWANDYRFRLSLYFQWAPLSEMMRRGAELTMVRIETLEGEVGRLA